MPRREWTPAHAEAQRRRRAANRERTRAQSRLGGQRWRAKINDVIRAAKDCPCTDCGVHLPPEIMDLDHVRGAKLFTLSHWQDYRPPAGQTKMEAVLEEIFKCDVRCPNCHRMRHFEMGEL